MWQAFQPAMIGISGQAGWKACHTKTAPAPERPHQALGGTYGAWTPSSASCQPNRLGAWFAPNSAKNRVEFFCGGIPAHAGFHKEFTPGWRPFCVATRYRKQVESNIGEVVGCCPHRKAKLSCLLPPCQGYPLHEWQLPGSPDAIASFTALGLPSI